MPLLRPATNADGPAIFNLVAGILVEFGLTPDPTGIDGDLKDIEANYLRGGGWFAVLEDETGAIVGSAGLFPIDAQTLELRKMYLHSSLRGRGWGRKLLLAALAVARARGARRVILETASRLTDAIALYERHGFTRYSPEHLAGRCDQAWILTLS